VIRLPRDAVSFFEQRHRDAAMAGEFVWGHAVDPAEVPAEGREARPVHAQGAREVDDVVTIAADRHQGPDAGGGGAHMIGPPFVHMLGRRLPTDAAASSGRG
jgi:hypothetical protein